MSKIYAGIPFYPFALSPSPWLRTGCAALSGGVEECLCRYPSTSLALRSGRMGRTDFTYEPMIWALLLLLAVTFSCPPQGRAQDAADHSAHHAHHYENHHMDMEGMVMNENTDRLPRDCAQISKEQTITVRAGKQYAHQFNGTMFTYDQQEWQVEPCSRVTVTLINDDSVRHQWMIHGLPRYLYPEGMFHLEVNGRGQKAGTFIVSSAQKTYLVHCDLAHHMEKGMKAQLKVGGGDGDLPSIPGITGPRQSDKYTVRWTGWAQGLMLTAGLLGVVLMVRGLRRPA